MTELHGGARSVGRGKSAPTEVEKTEAVALVRPIEELTQANAVAIAIRRYGDAWLHLGIAIAPDSEATSDIKSISLVHLKQHYDLAWETVDSGYHFVAPSIPIERQLQVAVLCEVVRDRLKGKLPFAVKYRDGVFDRKGNFVSKEGRGLTCATFVIAIFRSVGILLIRPEEWPERKSDLEWHQGVLKQLQKRKAPKEHIDAVAAEMPCARYLPQEVAAAGTALDLPASYAYAKPVGYAIRSSLPINARPEDAQDE